MKKFTVYETIKRVYQYEVMANNEEEAINFVRWKPHLANFIRFKTIEIDYEVK